MDSNIKSMGENLSIYLVIAESIYFKDLQFYGRKSYHKEFKEFASEPIRSCTIMYSKTFVTKY